MSLQRAKCRYKQISRSAQMFRDVLAWYLAFAELAPMSIQSKVKWSDDTDHA